jgi:hypothetical protein
MTIPGRVEVDMSAELLPGLDVDPGEFAVLMGP